MGQIEAFLAVNVYGTVRRAATALRLSQPAVSARLKALESSLEVRLFTRSTTGLTLSAAGRALKPRAEQILHAVAQAREAVHALTPAAGGVLEIAAALSICTYLLPDVLKRFRAVQPKAMVTVRSGHSKEVLEMVLQGHVELGVARSLHHHAVETLSLRDDPLILVARPGTALLKSARVHLEDVADQPIIFFDRGSSDWTLTHGLFRRAGLVPNVVLEVETIEAAKRMVQRGLGLAFLPRIAVARDIRRDHLAAIDIGDARTPARSIDVIRLRGRRLGTEASALLTALRATVAAAAPAPAPAARPRRRP